MERADSQKKLKLSMVMLPLVVDGGTAMVMFLWLPELSSQLSTPSGWNALLLVILYLLYCIGVYLSRKLLPDRGTGRWLPPNWMMDPKIRGLFGIIFAIFMTTTFAYQLGYFNAIVELRAGMLEEGSTAAFLVYAPGAWLGFSLLVILVLAFPVNASIPSTSDRYALFAFLSLLLTNGLLVFTGAQTGLMVNGLRAWSGLATQLVVLAALALSFGPARMIYQSRQRYLVGWLSFALLLLFTVFLATSV